MLSEILHKVAGFEREEHTYYPRPSMSGPERCLRQTVYLASGHSRDKQMADRFIHVLDDSSWHEELTADWIGKTAFDLNSRQMKVDCFELPFMSPPHMVSGSIDGILTDMMFVDYLWENKAINMFTFERYWNGVKEGIFPLDYFTQCACYLEGLRKINPSFDKAILLVKNKNTLQFFDYTLRYIPEADTIEVVTMSRSDGSHILPDKDTPIFTFNNVIASAIERFRLIHEHVHAGTFPERQYDLSDWQCQYCGYGETCWQDYEKEYSSLATNGILDGIEDILAKYVNANAELGSKRNPGFEQEYLDLKGKIVAIFDQANEYLQTSLPELCAYYLETKGHIDTLEEQKEAVKKEVRDLLTENRVRKATAGPYVIDDRLDKYSYLNRDKLDPAAVIRATEKRFKRVLTIRRPKA